MIKRKKFVWKCRDRTFQLGERTLIMGILNVTPDSFSDGGKYMDQAAAVARALEMVAQGADIIDVGGESTRPGAEPVDTAEEIRRTVPVIKKIREQTDVLISIDTMKAEVAFHALEAGADVVNDVTSLGGDPGMAKVVAESRAGAVLMHMKGTPQTMQDNPKYTDVIKEVGSYLNKRVVAAEKAGIERAQLVVDPGIGFGKTVGHNLELFRNLPQLAECGCPVLVGASRKSIIGKLLGRNNPEERLAGSLALAAFAIMRGVHILRVHDVLETCDVCRLVDTLLKGETNAVA